MIGFTPLPKQQSLFFTRWLQERDWQSGSLLNWARPSILKGSLPADVLKLRRELICQLFICPKNGFYVVQTKRAVLKRLQVTLGRKENWKNTWYSFLIVVFLIGTWWQLISNQHQLVQLFLAGTNPTTKLVSRSVPSVNVITWPSPICRWITRRTFPSSGAVDW